MKLLAYLLLLASLLMFATSGILADEDPPEDDEGSAFDEPGEEEEKVQEPFPATFPFKDYKLQLDVEDGRFWKHDKNYNENEQKAGLVLKLAFKLPKSDNPFDANVFSQAWAHNLKLSFPDGSAMGADNYKKLCDKFFSIAMESWKDVKDTLKPKKIKIGRNIKAYRFALTGTPEGWSLPIREEVYFFKFTDRTYKLTVRYTTSAARNERVTSEIESLLKSLKERKSRRR